jgi:ApaG protein
MFGSPYPANLEEEMMSNSPPAGPLSDAITEGLRVEVMARHVAEQSRPQLGTWAFEYTVRITNLSEVRVQLLSRHWIITDATDTVKEVRGPGVVGKQPVLGPGESFQYSSWCRLETPTGQMRGTYQMEDERGRCFDIEIAPFALRAPYTVQ